MNAARALWRFLQALLIRWQIWETEQWLADCARDGLIDGLCLRYIRADLSAMRVRLALLQTPACAKDAHKPATNVIQPDAPHGVRRYGDRP